MKIVCLIRPEPALIYFANQINAKHQVAQVILEKRTTLSKIKRHGIARSLAIGIKNLQGRKNIVSDYESYFEDKWCSLDSQISRLETEDINSDMVLSRLKEIKPDLLLDHGTSIVENRILLCSKMAFNLHWGLSPYYRGTHCTEWALVNWDPYNIGVTIHKLTKAIDGGSVLVQKRAEIRADDTAHSINMRLTQMGTDLMIKIIDKLEKGQSIHFEEQDFSLGYLTSMRQWNHLLERQIRYIERNNLLGLMLQKPSRFKRLPIVEREL